jgi:formylglycine-generating enzyme required for sulfatase activity
MTDCGVSHENCCTSLLVTGGTYYRTYDPAVIDAGVYAGVSLAADGGPSGEADPATVSSLRLDKYEVTVGRFRQFVDAWNAGWLPATGSGKHTSLNGGQGLLNISAPADGGVTYELGWIFTDNSQIAPTNANLSCDPNYATWTTVAGTHEELPINCVNWYEAYAFCIWDGGFLPSEAEWEYGAAGGSQQREYPWGSMDPGATNQYAIHGDTVDTLPPSNCTYPTGALVPCTGVLNIAPVGTATLGVGLWGQLDLVGNVFQWTLDLMDVDYHPCTDCARLMTDMPGPPLGTAGPFRVLRGGAFDSSTRSDHPAYRFAEPEFAHGDMGGFRCARSLQ